MSDATDRPVYGVTGDHPTLARPDKWGLTFEKALAYSDYLVSCGFEHVCVYERLPDGKCIPVP